MKKIYLVILFTIGILIGRFTAPEDTPVALAVPSSAVPIDLTDVLINTKIDNKQWQDVLALPNKMGGIWISDAGIKVKIVEWPQDFKAKYGIYLDGKTCWFHDTIQRIDGETYHPANCKNLNDNKLIASRLYLRRNKKEFKIEVDDIELVVTKEKSK